MTVFIAIFCTVLVLIPLLGVAAYFIIKHWAMKILHVLDKADEFLDIETICKEAKVPVGSINVILRKLEERKLLMSLKSHCRFVYGRIIPLRETHSTFCSPNFNYSEYATSHFGLSAAGKVFLEKKS